MNVSDRTEYALAVVGVALCALTARVGGSTQRACPGVDGAVYEAVGVDPRGVRLLGVELPSLALSWYDGCNWRTNSLVPLALGCLCLLAAVVIRRRGA
ncbi:hypothetical protein I7X12_05150 [Halosimplex litoreum]|uniref:Uncharacterized protein n=1 Tax=Halosimplex litoreum TaxID=1198301 RepID=A0A7T3KWG3_9EURY|nr:hypothetical protein [Halosimplex litoreum]QPV64018.1 hypothetical protein I7X12_05150 [Halosimplex litoreum]